MTEDFLDFGPKRKGGELAFEWTPFHAIGIIQGRVT